jgi:hypothetical protein
MRVGEASILRLVGRLVVAHAQHIVEHLALAQAVHGAVLLEDLRVDSGGHGRFVCLGRHAQRLPSCSAVQRSNGEIA